MTAGPVAGEVEVASAVENAGAAWPGAFDNICVELRQEFDARLPGDTVDRCFAAEVAKFHDARITAYLPILILRNTRARLRAIEARPLKVQD